MNNEGGVVPDSSEAIADRVLDSANDSMSPQAEATIPAELAKKRRPPLAVLIVVGLLIAVGSWWATSALLGTFESADLGEPAQVGGHVYTSAAGGYEITFPGEPEVTSAVIPIGDLEVEQITAAWSNDSGAHVAATAEFPADIVAAAGATILDASLEGMVANLPNSELRERTESTLDGEPALTGMIAKDGNDIWFTVAMHGNTQVILNVFVPTGEPAPTFAETFRFID